MRFSENFLTHARAERRGYVVVLILLALLFLLPTLWRERKPEASTDFSDYQGEIAAFREAVDAVPEAMADANAPEAFDPNTATAKQLQALALPEQTIRAWLSFVRKGGRFDRATDLERFRALSAADRERVLPYLLFSKESRPRFAATATEANFQPAALFAFDPNTISETELARLDLPHWVVRNWLAYRAKGGRFRDAEAVRKIYGLSGQDFQRIAPYLRFAETSPAAQAVAGATSQAAAAPISIDINKAELEEWTRLRGIGPVLGARILKFRDKLGGFHHVDQVAETYGLPDSTFQHIRSYLTASPVIRRLAINQLDAESLRQHPYLDGRIARALVSYREQHGPFTGPADLEKVVALPAEKREKLLPYLTFD